MAGIKGLLKDLEEEVSCAICQEIFKAPKVLPCLHAFCCECLNKFARTHRQQQQQRSDKHEPLRCPVCQEAIHVPESGTFDELPTSFHHNSLAGILEIYKKPTGKSTCESCDNKQAGDFYCFECGCLCNDCHQSHNTLKILRNHKVLQANDFNPQDIEVLRQKQAVCTEQYHNSEPLRYYCTQCQLCLCHICIIAGKKHKEHEINLIELTADESKREITDCVEQVIAKQHACVAKVECIKTARETLKESTQNARAKLQKTTERLIANILKQDKETSDKLNFLAAARDELLRDDENSANEELRKVKEILAFSEKMLEKGSALEILQAKGLIQNRVQELTSDTQDFKVTVGDTLTFIPTEKEEVKEQRDILGVLVTSDRCDPSQGSVELSCAQSVETTQEANFVVELRSSVRSLCHNALDFKEITVQIIEVNESQAFAKPMKKNLVELNGDEDDGEDDDDDDEEEEEEKEEEEEEEDQKEEKEEQEDQKEKEKEKEREEKEERTILNFDVKERADGKYQVVFRPSFPGKYKAQIKIKENHISNSPFTFRVKPRCLEHLKTLSNETQFGGKPLQKPVGVAASKFDFVAVCDSGNSRVLVFDDQLNYVREIGKEGKGDGEFKYPVAVTFDNKGDLVVADIINNTVQFFKLTGEFIKNIGSECQFVGPIGVFVDENNRLLVCDCKAVQIFDSEGVFQEKLEMLSDPINYIICSKLGVVSCTENSLRIGNDERVINSLSDIYEQGTVNGTGAFCKPTVGMPVGLAVTRSRNVLVCDYFLCRIWLMSPEGKVLAKYGDALAGNTELVSPGGIAAFSDGRVIVTEALINRIQLLK